MFLIWIIHYFVKLPIHSVDLILLWQIHCRKFRIEINFERIRVVARHSEICFQIILNQSKKCFKSHSTHSDRKLGLDKPELGFIGLDSDWEFSSNLFGVNRMEQDWVGFIFKRFVLNEIRNVFRIGSVWFRIVRKQISELIGFPGIGFLSEDLLGLYLLCLGFIRTDSDWKFGLDQTEFRFIQFYSDYKLVLDSFSLKSRIESN